MIARFTHRPAHPLGRRLLDAFRRRFLGGLGKSQRVWFVTIEGRRYKRIEYGDSAQARAVAEAVRAGEDVIPLPKLVHEHENELWFEFVEGQRPDAANTAHRAALARLFARMHAAQPRQAELVKTGLQTALLTDLEFLYHCRVLDESRYRLLQARAQELAPDTLWLGMDYVDPALKNVVMRDGEAVIIDLESLKIDSPLGTGIAKSVLHWLGDDRDAFAARVIELGAPDFMDQLDYVQLCLISGWTKRKLLAGKRRRIEIGHFDRCVR
jgi:hypothetical protein